MKQSYENFVIQSFNIATGKIRNISLGDLFRSHKEIDISIPKYPITSLSKDQWNIELMNLYPVWSRGYNGKGITIMIIDSGVIPLHPDLQNLDLSITGTATTQEPSEDPAIRAHGTRVASIAAATGTKYVTGVAWGSRLGSIRISSNDSTNLIGESDAYIYKLDQVDIYNISLQPPIFCTTIIPTELSIPYEEKIRIGTTLGRKGKGVIYVFAAGNLNDIQEQTPFFNVLNMHEVIVVGGCTRMGTTANYQNRGPAILISAPSGFDSIPNTGPGILAAVPIIGNRLPYTLAMNGTSASAPHISGLCALILQANKNLTWRDVQHILVYSSLQVYLPKEDEQLNVLGSSTFLLNTSGLYYDRNFGYGVPYAPISIDLAIQWILLPSEEIFEQVIVYNPPIVIPDTNTIVELPIEFPLLGYLAIETVVLSFEINGGRPFDLFIGITSPSGTGVSTMVVHIDPATIPCESGMYTIHTNIKDEAFRDETPYVLGSPWLIRFADPIIGSINTISSMKMVIHGYRRTTNYSLLAKRIREKILYL